MGQADRPPLGTYERARRRARLRRRRSQVLLVKATLERMSRHPFENVALVPADFVLRTAENFLVDKSPNKVMLGIGAYRDPDGKPWVLPCVRMAQERIAKEEADTGGNHEYLPTNGDVRLNVPTQTLLFGRELMNQTSFASRLCSMQSLSGTGALYIILSYVATKFRRPNPEPITIFCSNPTWANHLQISEWVGATVRQYRYWDQQRHCLDFSGMLEDLSSAKKGDAVILHACGHNPTGQDPSKDQWSKVLDVCRQQRLTVLLDCAYQGFASGNLDRDAYAIRLFAESGMPFFVAQSFAKNLGLYGDRIGMAHAVTPDAETAKAILSQWKVIGRCAYSSPSRTGANIVHQVLSNLDIREQWEKDLQVMAARLHKMRSMLRDKLEQVTTKDWSHLTNQIGMFSYTGLTPTQCQVLIDKHHIYLTLDGRISLAGLTVHNQERVGLAIADVVNTLA